MNDEWTRVGQAVRQRRNQLGLAQGAGGVSAATWRKIEKAVDPPYRTSTVLAVCRALGWTADSIDRLLHGDEPVETRPAAPPPLESDLEARVSALEMEMGWVKLELAARVRKQDPDLADGEPPAGSPQP